MENFSTFTDFSVIYWKLSNLNWIAFLKSKNTWNNKKKLSNFEAITTRNSATNRSIANRQSTPFTQCYQNLMASVSSTPAQSPKKSPSSPEYSKASSSSDESDSESDATPKTAWSVSSDSSSDEDE